MHTARGLIAIKDIRIGDTVFSLDEETCSIRPGVVSGIQGARSEVVEVKVGTRTLRAARDQMLLALVDRRKPGRQRRRFRREWIRLSDLKVGDIVAVARKTPDLGVVQYLPLPSKVRDRRARVVDLPVVTTDDLMWWIGLYAGDGYVHNTGKSRRVEFAIPASQPDVRDELKTVTKRLFGVEARAADAWRVLVPGIRLVDYVEAIGLAGTALDKRIPPWVFASPETHRLAFLGGYVDADGNIRTPAGRGHSKDMGLTSANRALLEDARRLAVTCGVRTSTIWDFRSRHPVDRSRWMTGYRMQFSGDFDRISCRSERRIARMRKRTYFRTDTAIGGTTIKSHTSGSVGFAKVDRVASIGIAETCALLILWHQIVVAEGLIVRASSA